MNGTKTNHQKKQVETKHQTEKEIKKPSKQDSAVTSKKLVADLLKVQSEIKCNEIINLVNDQKDVSLSDSFHQQRSDWKEVKYSKGRNRQTIIGNNVNVTIKGVPKLAALHAYRIDTTVEELESMLKMHFPEVKCDSISARHPELYSSYKDNLKYIRKQEQEITLNEHFFLRYNPNLQYRAAILNWLLKEQVHLNFSESEYYLAVNLLDHVLANVVVPINMYQLTIISTLWIAMKLIGSNFPKASTLISLCKSSYVTDQLLGMERKRDVIKKSNEMLKTKKLESCPLQNRPKKLEAQTWEIFD
ncbi:uncharacterized protein LOC111691792 [Anoplophora glabripennis]|uniref:uncharacterized protein LOC111691792 n=1 Tax=Anoplophora glabripennis TaxID=217634 RepID=UPI000C773829|nr:uncharacterized protein LOC111691792 [Anoplophora glabripennis]